MEISPNEIERGFRSLPANRRTIVLKTDIASYRVPAILRWLKRKELALNLKIGKWTPTNLPIGVDICWKHGALTLNGTCPACHSDGPFDREPAIEGGCLL